MKNLKQASFKTILIAIALVALFSGCSDDDMPATNKGYFPLNEGATWKYLSRIKSSPYSSDEDDAELSAWDYQFVIKMGGDSTIEGKKYKIITDELGHGIRLIRKVSTGYYYRQSPFTYTGRKYRDLKFLDEGLSGEGKWSYLMEGGTKIEFHQSTRKQHKINGKTFWNVKVVTVTYYYNFDESKTYDLGCRPIEKHFYARGVGEIQELDGGCYGYRENTLLDNN